MTFADAGGIYLDITTFMIKKLAKKIQRGAFRDYLNFQRTIFLCGAKLKTEGSIRWQIGRILEERSYSLVQYKVYYPENLFDDLLFGPNRHDLLTLENILADSVDAIVLVLESVGAIAELGSFVSNDKLRKKLICIVDKQHKADKSFINYGPLSLLRERREGAVVYINYKEITSEVGHIQREISKIVKNSEKTFGVENVVQSHSFVQLCIYLFDVIPRDLLITLVREAAEVDLRKAEVLTAGAISTLFEMRSIELTPNGYKLTQTGIAPYITLVKQRYRRFGSFLSDIDKIRVDVLSWKLRGKNIPVNSWS